MPLRPSWTFQPNCPSHGLYLHEWGQVKPAEEMLSLATASEIVILSHKSLEWLVMHQSGADTLFFWLKSIWFCFFVICNRDCFAILLTDISYTKPYQKCTLAELLPAYATGAVRPAAPTYISTCRKHTCELTWWNLFLARVCITYLNDSTTVPKRWISPAHALVRRPFNNLSLLVTYVIWHLTFLHLIGEGSLQDDFL